MKFRGMMNDSAAMRDFMNVVVNMSKIARECVMRITSNKLYFIISDEDAGPRTPMVWCELPVTFYFREYNVVGVNEEFNEIYLEFVTAMLAKSLATVKQDAKSLKVKLTNKQTPCITLEIELHTGEGLQNRHCVHDIPVEVIPRKYWGNYAEPHFNDYHVTMQMPHLKPVKNIVERMKHMNHSLTVSANKRGRLALQIKTNLVTLSAHFTDLSVESFAVGQFTTIGDVNDIQDMRDTVSVTVDIKKFLMFLTGMQINGCKTTCSIVNEKMVKLHMEQSGALSLQMFLTQLSL